MLSKYRVYRYDRLDSPAVTAGSAAVLIGAQSGLFPDIGYAVPGEMGGLWAGEKKVCDGFFLAIDDVPLRAADACEANPVSTAFHYRMQQEGLHIVRRQTIPDGVAGCIVELTVENLRDAPRLVEISFTVRTDILTVAAARGEDGLELGRDVGEYDERTQAFYARDSRNPWHAVWGADSRSRVLQSDLPASIYGFGNTQGKGINGRLFYRLRVGARGQASMKLFVAGGFASRSKAEDALALLRGQADALIEEKTARLGALMEQSEATLPDPLLTRCFNWTRIYSDWLTRALPRGGCALCENLPEHPALFGQDWARAISALLPLGGAQRAQEMLRTLVRVSEEAQLAPGRLAMRVTPGGRVTRVGSLRESAQFVALVHRTLLWSGDRDFAQEMLPETGLCISYLRRGTRGFSDVGEELAQGIRRALEGQAFILRMTGADDAVCLRELALLPPEREETLPEGAPPETAARWHGRQGHVEQMLGCLTQMAGAGLPGLPGALRGRDAEPGSLLCARAAADFIWPMTEDLFGLRPDAAAKTIAFAPHTPIGWDGWALDNVQIGTARVSVRSERVSPSQARYTVTVSEPGYTLLVHEGGEERRMPLDGEISLLLGD